LLLQIQLELGLRSLKHWKERSLLQEVRNVCEKESLGIGEEDLKEDEE